MKRRFLAAAAVFALISGSASAATIYDSGTPLENRALLANSQWLSARLQFGSDATVTGLEGYVDVTDGGELTVAILDQGVDGPGAALFSQTVSVDSGAPQWVGATGLDWSLSAGTYWFAFEIAPASSLRGNFWGTAPNPVGRYDDLDVTDGHPWSFAGPIDLGIRISGAGGQPIGTGIGAQVPEPTAWSLMIVGFGLAGAAIRRRSESRSWSRICRNQIHG